MMKSIILSWIIILKKSLFEDLMFLENIFLKNRSEGCWTMQHIIMTLNIFIINPFFYIFFSKLPPLCCTQLPLVHSISHTLNSPKKIPFFKSEGPWDALPENSNLLDLKNLFKNLFNIPKKSPLFGVRVLGKKSKKNPDPWKGHLWITFYKKIHVRKYDGG